MILGSPLIDTLAFVAIGLEGAFLLLLLGQYIDYKRDCKKYGEDTADEIWKRDEEIPNDSTRSESTAQEAKARLERIWKNYTSAYDCISDDDVTAFDMAVEALEKQIPKRPMKSIDPYMEDLYKLISHTETAERGR